MTKAASTSIELALSPYCDMAYYGNSRIKHLSYRKYQRFVQPYLASLGYDGIETCCLMRDPVDWLFSWYRYRSRAAVNGRPQSTADMSFDEFVSIYLARPDNSKGVGRPSRFIANKNGEPSVDHIFKYENLPVFISFLEERFDTTLLLDRMNESPTRDFALSPDLKSKLQEYFTPEYEIYENARG